jgi:hypothetical protein
MLEGISGALGQVQKMVAECAAATREAGPALDPDILSAVSALRLLQTSQPARARTPERRWARKRADVGRRVSVLWVPRTFDDALEPSLEDLAPFCGLVVKKRGRSLLVKYDDGSLSWARRDKLLSFLD